MQIELFGRKSDKSPVTKIITNILTDITQLDKNMQSDKDGEDEVERGDQEKLSETQSQEDKEENIHYKKNKKIIFWLYLLLGALFVASQGYLVARNWEQMQVFANSDNYYYSNQVAYQWQQGFITDVQVSSTAACPSGYERAINFDWPGTGFGCYCQPNVNTSFVLQGYCTPSLIQSSCRNIQSQDQRLGQFWRNSSNVCIKRSSVSFATQQKYDGNNKICGSSQSLTIVPQSEPCPLVNLTFDIPALEDHYNTMADPDEVLNPLYGSFNATSPYSFYSYPIIKFAVSEHQFCLMDQDGGLTPGHKEFILLNYQRNCEEIGGNFQTLDQLTEIQFYANNPNLDQLSSIDGFPKPGNWVYKLGLASLPSWTYYCRHNYDSKFSVPRALDILNFQFFAGYYYIALVEILLLSSIACVIFVLALRRIIKKQVYPTGYKQVYLPKDFCIAITRYIIDFTCKAVIFALALYSTWVCIVNWNWFKSAINLGCAGKEQTMVTHVMEPFRDMYEYGIVLLIGQMAVLVFVIAIDIIHFCYVYRHELQHYLVDSYLRKMVEVDKDKDLDWLNKDQKLETDNKMLQFEEVMDDNASEKFRVTMAMNVFDPDRSIQEEAPSRGKILKKKKKKIGGFKRQEKKESVDYNTLGLSDSFNPYSLDQNSLIGLNSMDTLNVNRSRQPDAEQEEREETRGRRKNRGRKSKK